MQSKRRSSRFDRRREMRQNLRLPGLVGPGRTPPQQCEHATIEEMGDQGLRIRSAKPLNVEDSLVLYVEDNPEPVRARVVWVRKDGIMVRRHTGKASAAFVAGCRIGEDELTLSTAFEKLQKSAVKAALSDLPVRIARVGVIVGAALLAGMVVYAGVSLASLLQ